MKTNTSKKYHRTNEFAATGLALMVALSLPAAGQETTGTAMQGGHHGEMMGQMHKMHNDMMSMKMSGNPDIDFVMMMIPHHQGAVDMAKTQLKYGKDAKLRSMAEQIISSQEKEIKEMQERLKELKKAQPSTGMNDDSPAAHSGHSM